MFSDGVLHVGITSRIVDKFFSKVDKASADRRRRVAQGKIQQRCSEFSTSRGCVVVGNAIPKSGTYLLSAIFRELGAWGNPDIHVLDSQTFLMNPEADTTVLSLPAVDSIRALSDGVFVAAHLHYSSGLSAEFGQGKVKHIFQYRDFRDVFLSYASYFAFNDNSGHWERPRREQAFFREFFQDHRDRVSYAICKTMEQLRFEEYAGWLRDPNTLVFRFEEVYDELASSRGDSFGSNMERLFAFLEIEGSEINAADFAGRVLGSSRTRSNSVERTKRFEREFEPEHVRLLENARFSQLMSLFDLTD
jgi:hypothetical protein